MASKRFARLSNGFSKKIDYHLAAVALHVAFYNLCRVHESLRSTPAMTLGIADRVWTISDLIEAALKAVPTEPTPTPAQRRQSFRVIQGDLFEMRLNDKSAQLRGACWFRIYQNKAMIYSVIRAGCQARARFAHIGYVQGPLIREFIHGSGSFVMPNWALWAVRILRRLPHTRRFDNHLTDCAAVAIEHEICPDRKPLALAHVFLARVLPNEGPCFFDGSSERVERTVFSENGGRSNMKPILVYVADRIQRGA